MLGMVLETLSDSGVWKPLAKMAQVDGVNVPRWKTGKTERFPGLCFSHPDVAPPLLLSTAWAQIAIPPRAKENPSQESRDVSPRNKWPFSYSSEPPFSWPSRLLSTQQSLLQKRFGSTKKRRNVFPLTHFTTRACRASSFWCSAQADCGCCFSLSQPVQANPFSSLTPAIKKHVSRAHSSHKAVNYQTWNSPSADGWGFTTSSAQWLFLALQPQF